MRFFISGLAVSLICAGAPASAQAPAPKPPAASPRFAIVRIPVTDIAKVEPFYRNVFQMKDGVGSTATEKVLAFADSTSPVFVLALTKQAPPPGDTPPFAVSVPDLDFVLSQAPRFGGTVAEPARSMGAYGRIAFVKDPAGTRIEVLESPKTAAR